MTRNMYYRTDVKPKTKKLLKILSWIFFGLLIVCVALTIVFRHNNAWVFLLLSDLALLTIMIFFLSWYGQINQFERIKDYLANQTQLTVVDEFVRMMVAKEMSDFIQLYKARKYYYDGDVVNGEPTFTFSKQKNKTQLVVILKKNKFIYFVGDSRTEWQDIEDNEYITVNYSDINTNCTATDFMVYVNNIDMKKMTKSIKD